MTPSEQNRAIAKWMGWTKIHTGYPMDGVKPGSVAALRHLIPNFYGDLNACHQAELHMDKGEAIHFYVVLGLIGADYFRTVSATSPQRCEALLRTLGLWRKGE